MKQRRTNSAQYQTQVKRNIVINQKEKDLQILRELINGNTFPFIKQYKGLFHYSRQKAGLGISEIDKEDIEDIFSEVITDLINDIKTGRYIYKSRLSTYLYYRFLNKLNYLYKLRKYNVRAVDINHIADSEKSVEDKMDREVQLKVLYSNLSKISSHQQNVIKLHYLKGLKYKEIASLLRTSENSVKASSCKGIAKLRVIMNPSKNSKKV